MKTTNLRAFGLCALVSMVVSTSMQRVLAADVLARWVGGSGDWTNAANWDIGLVPNNAGGTTYSVILDVAGSDAVITVNQSITINGLVTFETLQVTNPATLTLLGGVTNAGTLAVLGGTLRLSGATVVNTGHAITVDRGAVQLAAGTIRAGTVTTMNGAKLIGTTSGGTLDGVMLNGDLDLTVNAAYVTVINGLVLNGTVSIGTASGYDSRLDFSGSQMLSGTGTVVLGAGTYAAMKITSNGATLTLGPGITVRCPSAGGSRAVVGVSDWGSQAVNVGVINQGTIIADASGRTIAITAHRFTNLGSLQALNGGTVEVANLLGDSGPMSAANNGVLALAGSWTFTNAVTVSSGGVLSLTGNWTNASTITANNATVNLGGNLTLARLGTFNRTGGTVNLTGTLNNTGLELALNATAGSWQLLGGTILGGTVSATGGAKLMGTASGGTLDGVTLNGNLDVTVGNGAYVTAVNGLVLNGTVSIGPTSGYDGRLDFAGSQTLSGTGTLVLGGSGYSAMKVTTDGATLTLGPGITVRCASAGNSRAGLGLSSWGSQANNVGVINQGTILADANGRTIAITAHRFTNLGSLQALNGGTVEVANLVGDSGPMSAGNNGVLTLAGSWTFTNPVTVSSGGTLNLTGNLTNASTITANNATVNLGGSFTLARLGTFNRTGGTVNLTGTLNNTGLELVLNATAGSWQLLGGTIRGGTVSTTGGAKLMGTTSGGTLDGVTLNGNLDVSVGNGAYVTTVNGLVLNGTVSIGPTSGYDGRLDFAGSQTLSGTGTLVLGGSGYTAMKVSTDGATLTLGPGITVRCASAGNSQAGLGLSSWGSQANNVGVINQGTILADASGRIIAITAHRFTNQNLIRAVSGGTVEVTSQNFSNEGNLEVLAGGTVDCNGPLRFDNLKWLACQPGGTFKVGGNLLGSTRNIDQYLPPGTTTFDGSGTLGSPQLLEVMGADLGADPAGFTHNFVYGSLGLANNTYVKLVDQADNAAGASAEALYVNSVSVPSGCTLDLNGLHVYTRGPQIAGTVANGSISQVPDGGAITFGNLTPGSIAVVGQLDEWTFFGRSGRLVTIVVDPGSGSAAPPYLGYVQAMLLDSNGTVLATNSNASSGQVLVLPEVTLPADGTYRVQVKASVGHTDSTGNYAITVWEVTPNVAPLVLNEQVVGTIKNIYSVDRWTFSARAGTQVQFDLMNVSRPGLAFSLTGPSGWVGFNNLTADSGLIPLPSSGGYTLTARSAGTQYDIAYAFRLLETLQTDLPLGTTFSGQFAGSGQAQLFRVGLSSSMPMFVTLHDASTSDRSELYFKFGSPPTRGDYDYRFVNAGSSDQRGLVSMAAPGTWYVLVYADSIPSPSTFTIQALASPILLLDVTPNRHGNSADAALTLAGAGFDGTTTFQLIAAGGATYPAAKVEQDSFTQMTATMASNSVPAGRYSVRVARSDGESAVLANAFEMTAGGKPKFRANVILPDTLGYHQLATLYIEYANDGDVAMPAPLVSLTPTQKDRTAALLTLDKSRVTDGFWTTAIPEGFANSVQILASGKVPGVLQPGESDRIPVYWVGWQQPWEMSYPPIQFRLAKVKTQPAENEYGVLVYPYGIIHNSPNRSLLEKPIYIPPVELQTIDWAAFKAQMRPESMNAEAWDVIFANFTNQVGSTWGEYVAMLDENAAYLGRLGQKVTDVSSLWNFEVQQAIGLNVLGTLASSVDLAVPAPGLSIGFNRVYPERLDRRYALGAFGRGWTTAWSTSLRVQADGAVEVVSPNESVRRFEPDGRSGGYFAPPGESSMLSASTGGQFVLQEQGGFSMGFLSDGKLGYVEDSNGNRITASYSSDRLSSLAHSSGQWLSISYNAAGLIQTITDSFSRSNSYTYDAANQHLISVQTFRGQKTTYAYRTGAELAYEHALASVTYTDGSHQYYDYDSRGRVVAVFRDGNAERIEIGYDDLGTVTITNANGDRSRTFYDHKGDVAKTEAPCCYSRLSSFDDVHRLTRITDSEGRSQSFTFGANGAVASQTSAMGQIMHFTYLDAPRGLSSVTDARGNTSRYSFDSRGNPSGIIYPDNSQTRFTHDAIGNLLSVTNRRGEEITYSYDAAGRVTRETRPNGQITESAYDLRGNLLTVSNFQGVILFEYDTADNMTQVTYPNGRFLVFMYDAAGHRAKMIDHLGFTVNYAYDAVGRLSALTDGSNAPIVSYVYDAVGRLARKVNGNGTYTTFAYDSGGRVLQLINYAPTGSVNSRFDYGYDSSGRVSSISTLDGQWTYQYDSDDQLTRALFVSSGPAVPNQDLTYAYDPSGNRVKTIENGSVTDYAANALNQYTSIGTTACAYDAEGNLVAQSGGLRDVSYQYDTKNRLVRVVAPEGTWEYEYDALGNRTGMIHNGQRTEYLADPNGMHVVVGEFNAAGDLVARYTYGLGLVACMGGAGGMAYYDFDAFGSTAGLTGDSGLNLNRYAYGPFGQELLSLETLRNPYKFVGGFGVSDDASGLLFMRARSYHRMMGRFCSEDPIGFASGDLNLYRYVMNSPVTRIDPEGLESGRMTCHVATRTVTEFVVWPWARHPNCTEVHENVHASQCRMGWVRRTLWECNYNEVEALHAQLTCAYENFPLDKDYYMDIRKRIELARKNKYPGCDPDDYPPMPPPDPPHDPGPDTPTRGPGDPNTKTGPAGFGAAGYVTPVSLLPYHIDFENQPTATAPAQFVIVTDQLDGNLDWSTLELKDIGFGDQVIPIPGGSQHFQTVVPMSYNNRSFEVHIKAGLDRASGKLTIRFMSIDPATSLPPDVLTGFLPPEDGTGRGQGHIGYTIRLKPNVPTGTQIRNIALIQFDFGEIIATNQRDPHNPAAGMDPAKECLNTVDSGAPVSGILPLATPIGRTFIVNWAGLDDANGVANYDVYLSTNGTDYTRVLERTETTSATFTGDLGHTYWFKCNARDQVGNEETLHLTADAFTTVYSNAPVLVSVTNQTLGVGANFNLTNLVQGLPVGSFLFTLGPGAPDGLSLNPTNGIVNWKPSCHEGNTTNNVTVWMMDSGWTNMTDAVTFLLVVKECLQPTLGTLILPVGERGRLPINLVTTEALTNLAMTLSLPPGRLIDPGVEIYELATNLVCNTSIEPMTNLLYLINLMACTNQLMYGTQQVAWLWVTAAPNQRSAFVDVAISDFIGTQPGGVRLTNATTQVDRVVIIGREPLLEASLSTNQSRVLTLYGNRGTNYQVLYTTTLATNTIWHPGWQAGLTNLFQVFTGVGTNSPATFYRAIESP